MKKSLAEINQEIEDFERDKGWLDQDFSFGERMALLHSEVSEALEAWRDHGLTPWYVRTYRPGCANCSDIEQPECPEHPSKPEGVGAEFADIFIRLVGDCRRDGVTLYWGLGRFGLPDRFGEQMQVMHLLIDHLYMAWEAVMLEGDGHYQLTSSEHTVSRQYGKVYGYLLQLCELHGIDLEAEYERKMAYNRTRPYRHGGRAL